MALLVGGRFGRARGVVLVAAVSAVLGCSSSGGGGGKGGAGAVGGGGGSGAGGRGGSAGVAGSNGGTGGSGGNAGSSAGASGSSGGSAGGSGGSGASGGTTGGAGSAGTGGAGGSAGNAGRGGAGGSAGSAGTGGTSGAGGGAGSAGRGGSGGGAGSAGTGGAGGSGASAGRGGAGSAGTGGTSGAGGNAGGSSGGGGSGGSGGGGGSAAAPLFDPCAVMGVTYVRAVAYLPGGSSVIVGLAGGVAKLLDSATARELRTFIGHAGAVNAVAISNDGTLLATASDDRTVKIWRIADAALLGTLAGHGRELLSVALSPDTTRVAAGAADGEVFLWTRANSALVASKSDHIDAVRAIGFAAAGTRVFSGSLDGSTRVWSGTDLAPVATPLQGSARVMSLAVSPDDTLVAVADAQSRIILRRAADGVQERSLPIPGPPSAVAFSPDGARLYIASETGVSAIPAAGGAVTLLVSPIGSTRTLAVRPDGHAVFIANDWALWLIDETGTSIRPEVQVGPLAQSVAFWPDGSRLAVGGDFGLVVRALPAGDVAQSVLSSQFAGRFNGVAVSRDGVLATAKDDGLVQLWSTTTWQITREVLHATIRASDVAFSPNGASLAVSGAPGLGAVFPVDADAGTDHYLGLGGDSNSVAFSPDGSLVAAGSEDRKLAVLRVADWSDVRRIDSAHSPTVDDLAFTPDNQRIASIGDERVTLWELAGSTARRDLLRQSGFLGKSLTISPDGALLVAGGSDGLLRVWSLADLAPLASLPAHGQGVVTVRFAPNGNRLAAAYDDGTVWLWCRR